MKFISNVCLLVTFIIVLSMAPVFITLGMTFGEVGNYVGLDYMVCCMCVGFVFGMGFAWSSSVEFQRDMAKPYWSR